TGSADPGASSEYTSRYRTARANAGCKQPGVSVTSLASRSLFSHPIAIPSLISMRLPIVQPFILLALLFGPAACSRAVTVSNGPVPQASVSSRSTGVTDSDVRRLLGALADDSMEGRGTATRGSERAARFIAAELQRYGVQPAGDSGFFQRVPVAVATS